MCANKHTEEYLLPFDVIQAAVKGEPEALAKVLKHFEGYIVKMSTRIFYDEFGQSYYQSDPELKQRIECRLIAQIVQKFKLR